MRKTVMCSVMIMVLATMLVGGTSVQVFAGDRSAVRDFVRESNLPKDIERYVLDQSLANEFSAMKGPDLSSNCGGSFSGICGLVDLGGGLLAIAFMRGPANSSFTVYWTCTNSPNGCHDDACSFVTLGTLTTDASGRGVFYTILGGSPFPGSYMHWDIIGSGTYTSLFSGIPTGAASAGEFVTSSGDPSR